MAITAVWKCDRDGKMFNDKKEAEIHDKMLELAANITSFIETALPDINESHSEAIGLLLAERRDLLAQACKGKPAAILADLDKETVADNTVTPLKATQ